MSEVVSVIDSHIEAFAEIMKRAKSVIRGELGQASYPNTPDERGLVMRATIAIYSGVAHKIPVDPDRKQMVIASEPMKVAMPVEPDMEDADTHLQRAYGYHDGTAD